ncbi:hypothetical protein [Brachybacterium sp. GPGPB12]|uniref:hypothetical protein n=1 Tax=Brachybacterium sp. GPGPB12 TaxID=3023517 RepID=UPI0031345615
MRELAEIAGGALATMTIAPEAAGADEVIDALAGSGAVPSLGHTDGGGAEMIRAVDRSLAALRHHRGRSPAPTATHLFNGMRPIHHRDPGPALAALDAASRGEIMVEVIADGVHLDARTVAHVFSIAAEDHVVLVTDAMAAAGMADGRYRLGALDVTVEGGVATLTEGGAIAGGTAHLVDVAPCGARGGSRPGCRGPRGLDRSCPGAGGRGPHRGAGRRSTRRCVAGGPGARPVTVPRGGREV